MPRWSSSPDHVSFVLLKFWQSTWGGGVSLCENQSSSSCFDAFFVFGGGGDGAGILPPLAAAKLALEQHDSNRINKSAAIYLLATIFLITYNLSVLVICLGPDFRTARPGWYHFRTTIACDGIEFTCVTRSLEYQKQQNNNKSCENVVFHLFSTHKINERLGHHRIDGFCDFPFMERPGEMYILWIFTSEI